jgi:hypothetical protein
MSARERVESKVSVGEGIIKPMAFVENPTSSPANPRRTPRARVVLNDIKIPGFNPPPFAVDHHRFPRRPPRHRAPSSSRERASASTRNESKKPRTLHDQTGALTRRRPAGRHGHLTELGGEITASRERVRERRRRRRKHFVFASVVL